MDGKGRFSSRQQTFQPVQAEGFDALAQLALNLRWSWSHKADKLWRRLAPDLWGQSGNPWVVLQTVFAEKFRNAMADPEFRGQLEGLLVEKREADEKPAWFQNKHAGSPLTLAAYFSMEFMLSEALNSRQRTTRPPGSCLALTARRCRWKRRAYFGRGRNL